MALPTTGLSDEGKLILAIQAGTSGDVSTYSHNQIASSAHHGKLRVAAFSVTLAAQGTGTYLLCRLPAGAKILRGEYQQSVTFGATATVAIGAVGSDNSGYLTADNSTTADSTSLFRAAATSTSTALTTFADTTALKAGYVLEKEWWVTVTVAAAALPASGTWTGAIIYSLE